MPGVYSIRNKTNGKVYVGSTTRNIMTRFSEHKHNLRHNKHSNLYLQHAWNKYGENCFEFSVIESVDFSDNIIEIEQFYIDVFFGDNCYNIRPIADNNKGTIRTIDVREKHSITMKLRHGRGSKIAVERSIRMKGIPQPEKADIARQMKIKTWEGFISPNGVEYYNIEDLVSFANEHNLNAQGLRRLGRKERKHYKGWRVVKS